MKLLSPTEVRDSRARELARDVLRVKEMSDATDKARKALANAEADFSRMLASQRERWAKEEQEHDADVKERTKELAELERAKEKALVPIHLLEKEAQDTLSLAKTARLRNERELEDTEVLKEHLESALDEIGAREVDVSMRENRVVAMEQSIERQQRILESNSIGIKQQYLVFHSEQEKARRDMERIRVALTLQERELEAKAERLERTEQQLEGWAKRLQDERGTLDRIIIRNKSSAKKE